MHTSAPAFPGRPPLQGRAPADIVEIADARLRDLDTASRTLNPLAEGRQADWVRADAQVRNTSGSLTLAGNAAPPDVVRRLQRRPPQGHLEPLTSEHVEVVNHLRFYDRLRTVRPPRSARDLEDIHEALFRGIFDDAGTLRQGGADDGPERGAHDEGRGQPHDEVDSALQRMRSSDAHPAVAAAVLTHELDRIRPFRAGNARVARALNHVILETSGHHGVRFALIDDRLARHAARFHAVRDAARQNHDAVTWGRFLAHQLAAAFEEASDRVAFACSMPRHLNQRQWLIADWFAQRDHRFPGRRARFRDVEAEFGWVPTRTLKRDLARLRDEEILVMEGRLKGADYHMAERFSPPPPT